MFRTRTKNQGATPPTITKAKEVYDAQADRMMSEVPELSEESWELLASGVAQYFGNWSIKALQVAVSLMQDIHQLPESTIELIAKNRDEAEKFSKELMYVLQREGEKFVFFDKEDEGKDIFAERLAKNLFVTTRRGKGIPVGRFLWLCLGESLNRETISERSGVPRGLISKAYTTIIGKLRRQAKAIQKQIAAEEELQRRMQQTDADHNGGEVPPSEFDQIEFNPGAKDGADADAGAENGEVPEAT